MYLWTPTTKDSRLTSLRFLLLLYRFHGRLPPPSKDTKRSARIDLSQGRGILLDKNLYVQEKCDKLSQNLILTGFALSAPIPFSENTG